MWWTQSKLALIAIGINFVVCAAVVLSVDNLRLRLASLVAVQLALVSGYTKVAGSLGRQHLDGDTEDRFNRRLWDRAWSPSIDRTYLPPNVIPQESGASFYRQILGDTEPARRSLYAALATWEGARLLWAGSLVGVTAAIFSATAFVTIAQYSGSPPLQILLGALAISAWVLIAPEAAHILLLHRSLLRQRAVERVAVLMPRDASDLGLRETDPTMETGWDGLAAIGVALGAPVAIVVTLLAGLRGLMVTVGLVAFAGITLWWTWNAFLSLLVNIIPFIHFDGPVGVSVLLDLTHRRRAHLSLMALAGTPYVLAVAVFPSELPLLTFHAIGALGYLVAMTFGDQFAGYAGFGGATRFEECFKRSMAKAQGATS